MELIEFVNKTVESYIPRKTQRNLEKDGDYFRKFIKRFEVHINGLIFIFDKLRYFNKEGHYIKTLFIIVLNYKRLEDDHFYVSFTGETKDLDNNDKNKFTYGLFSKKLIPKDPSLYLIEITGVPVKLLKNVRYDPFFYIYSADFFSKNPDYPYMGINVNPLYLMDNNDFCLAAFVYRSRNKNLKLHEVQETNKYKYFGSVTIPTLYFENIKEIKEDEELIWNN